jgi:hypothetical protein
MTKFWVQVSGIAFVVTVLGIWLWIESTPAPRVAPPAGQALVIDKSARAQTERKAVIDGLMEKGLLRRIDGERAGTVRASLRPGFYLMDDDTRRRYIDVIYAYYFDGSSVNDTVILRDARHGNEVGTYNPYRGGLNMYK